MNVTRLTVGGRAGAPAGHGMRAGDVVTGGSVQR